MSNINKIIGKAILGNPQDNPHIFQVVKNTKRKLGILAAFKLTIPVTLTGDKVCENPVVISFAKCRNGDDFDVREGLGIARNRANHIISGKQYVIPFCMRKSISEFQARTQKYFKAPIIICPNALVNGNEATRFWAKYS